MSRNVRRGIFFDLDGTLADSVGVMRRVFDGFAQSCGREATDAEFDAANGPPMAIFVSALKRAWELPQSLDELQKRYSALIDSAYLDVSPAPGATVTLETAFRNGWSVGVVTSNTAARSRTWLARTRLSPFVDIVVGGDEVCLGKPEPEPYRIALARSGCARELSIAVEDSLHGTRSATAAGLRTFAVSNPNHAPIEWPEGVRLIESLEELIPELARQRVRRIVGQR
jgi:beta-phosphoglucomutase-like phosphatase (HAD superfamily)